MKIIKQQQGTNTYQIRSTSDVIIGDIPRKRGEHEDDFKARAQKAVNEVQKTYKN